MTGLPQDIPDFLEIDVTNLNLDDKICIGDLQYPQGIETEIETDKIVLVINESRLDDTITEDVLEDKSAEAVPK